MPANVLIDSTPVENDEMALEDNSILNTCTAAQVNEPMAEQMRLEFESLKIRVQKAESEAQRAKENLRKQSGLLLAWRRQLTEQESTIDKLKRERDRDMCEIASSVLLVEAELRKEQRNILRLVEEKESVITTQEQQIRALLVLNRKLANNFGQSDIYWRNNATPKSNNSKKVHFGCDSSLRRTQSDANCNNFHLNGNVNGFENEDDITCDINDDDEQIVIRSPWDKAAGRHVPTLEALDEVAEEIVDVNGFNNEQCVTTSNDNLSGHAASFNRVMSTHRSVTKPKDVKYKKINRVKSRSLEELRGKLRNWTHPFFVSEKTN